MIKFFIASGGLGLLITGFISTSYAVKKVDEHEVIIVKIDDNINKLREDVAFIRGQMERKIK